MNSKKTIRLVYNLIIIALVLTGLFIVVDRFVHFGRIEFTDNARIEQHITPVNTRIAGFIREVRFEEYQHVRRGDTLVIIEDAEYRLAVAQARAGLANAQAGHSVAGAGITTTTSTISATAAAIDEARVQMENAGREDERLAALLRSEAVTQHQYDTVHTAYLAAQSR